jgi:hypothetical protein
MTIPELLEVLLEAEGPICMEALIDEASVHLPRRGSVWVASYRDENGVQRWRSTGQRDRVAAQTIAGKLEAEARRKRAAQAPRPAKPTIRVRAGSAEHALGFLSQKEVAIVMKISERAVRAIERRAFDKLRRHPALRQFWDEWQGGGIEEAGLEWQLSPTETAALYALARTPEERQVLRKVMALMARF